MKRYVYFCGMPSASSSAVKALLEPFDYISANPGKDMRSRLIQAFNLWLKVPEDKTSLIARIVTMLHNASLLYASTSLL